MSTSAASDGSASTARRRNAGAPRRCAPVDVGDDEPRAFGSQLRAERPADRAQPLHGTRTPARSSLPRRVAHAPP